MTELQHPRREPTGLEPDDDRLASSAGDDGPAARYGSGRAVPRTEDRALVAGQGRYADDPLQPGQWHVAFVRSGLAHGRIVAIDTAAAQALPGVQRVYTGADLVAAGVKPLPTATAFKRPDGSRAVSPPRHVLAHDVVRFVGEAVAAVVADSAEAAAAGARAVFVEIEERAAVTEPVAALAADAPRLCAGVPDNIAAEMQHGDATAAAAAFARAAHTVSLDLVNQRLAPSPMEPRASIAWLDDGTGRLIVRLSSQMPTSAMQLFEAALPGVPAGGVRVLVGDIGGGFGQKATAFPEDVVVAFAALDLKRPVRWVASRLEEFLSSSAGRDTLSRAELALDADGRVLALRVRGLANVGAYATGSGVAIPLMVGPWVSTSVYDIPTIHLQLTAVLTNTAPVGAYRGAGRPEAIYLIERLMDAAARRLGIAPAELRRRNLIGPDRFPYRNPMKQVYDCGRFESILDQALRLAESDGFDARHAQSAARGRLRGRAVVSFLEWTGGGVFKERVVVTVSADGIIEIDSATQAMGQGIATSYAQLAVEVFDVPIEAIRIVQGDTDRNRGFGSGGSRSLFAGGSAVRVVAQQAVDQAKTLAGEALEAAPADLVYAAGRFAVAGTDLGIGLFELAGRQPDRRIRVDATSAVEGESWPNAAHVCEVEIDPATGQVEIVAYASVSDIGRIVSPEIVRGQVEGGAVQGIGQALCEAMHHDPSSGQLLTASFMDYALPRIDGFRGFRTAFDTSIPTARNPLGVKGVGELGTIGATPVVVNAVLDALHRAGRGVEIERLQMPLTSEKVWRALRGDVDGSPFGRFDASIGAGGAGPGDGGDVALPADTAV